MKYRLKRDLKEGDIIDVDLGDDLCEEVKDGDRWKPELGEVYFWAGGQVEEYPWDGDKADEWNYKTGACFRTEKEAKEHKKKLEFIAEFLEFYREHGVAYDFDSAYYIYLNDDGDGNSRPCIAKQHAFGPMLGLYRFSEQSAQAAIDKFGDKLHYLFR